MSAPIRKNELEALESMARAKTGTMPDEVIGQRLLALGMIEQSQRGWAVTKRGAMELQRRKALQRTPMAKPR
jgi:hypothetical protein